MGNILGLFRGCVLHYYFVYDCIRNMQVKLHYLRKTYSGGMTQRKVLTFITACNAKKLDVQLDTHVYWSIHKTLQSGKKSIDGFSVVGLALLEEEPVVVKLILSSYKATQELKVSQHFREHPHVNIVHTFCEFVCKDNDFRWIENVIKPKCLCKPRKGSDGQAFTVLVQEYVKEGDINGLTWTTNTWVSTLFQLTYAAIEWYEQGFVYKDWHYGNILLKKTRTKTHTYNAFNRSWAVQLNGVRPIITDFSNSDFIDVYNYNKLALQIAEIWFVFKDDGTTECKNLLTKAHLKMSRLTELQDVLDYMTKIFDKIAVL